MKMTIPSFRIVLRLLPVKGRVFRAVGNRIQVRLFSDVWMPVSTEKSETDAKTFAEMLTRDHGGSLRAETERSPK
jgi:hypothetical protein